MLGEILTWLGVTIAAGLTYAMYRSAERAALSSDTKDRTDD